MDKKLKIIYLHQYFNTPAMSGGTRSYEMAKRLVSAGHEVHMITSWREGAESTDWFEENIDGINVHWLPVKYSNHMSNTDRIKAFFHFAFSASKKASLIKADIVFATSTPLTICLPGIIASKFQKIPMVFEVRDLWPELPIAIGALRSTVLKKVAFWLEKFAYKNSEAIVALSPGMRDGIVATGYSADRVAVIPNSCDNCYFTANKSDVEKFRKDRPWLQDRPLLVYAGTFGKINGVSYLVELALHLKHISPEIRLLLVGDGLEKTEVIEKAKSLNVLGVNLFIEDSVPKNQIPVLLGAADISCSLFIDIPAMRANSANKFFDTLAASKPIFINYGGWQADLITKHECGIIAWGLPLEKAAKELSDRITNKQWLSAAGQSSKYLAENYFCRDTLAKNLECVLTVSEKRNGISVKKILDSAEISKI